MRLTPSILCLYSLSNKQRKCVSGRYQLLKVVATKSPNTDAFMETETSATLKANDRELSTTQFFVLDALAPLTTIIEKGDTMQPDAIRDVTLAAMLLIGNASSRMQREKIIGSSTRLYSPFQRGWIIWSGSIILVRSRLCPKEQGVHGPT